MFYLPLLLKLRINRVFSYQVDSDESSGAGVAPLTKTRVNCKFREGAGSPMPSRMFSWIDVATVLLLAVPVAAGRLQADSDSDRMGLLRLKPTVTSPSRELLQEQVSA